MGYTDNFLIQMIIINQKLTVLEIYSVKDSDFYLKMFY